MSEKMQEDQDENPLPAGSYGRLDAEISPGRHLVLFVPEPMTDEETLRCIRELGGMVDALAQSLIAREETPEEADAGTALQPLTSQFFGHIMDDPERREEFAREFEGNPVLRSLWDGFREACRGLEEPGVMEELRGLAAKFGFASPARPQTASLAE